ncbi:MAG: BON domain-containing protein [Chitinivibrionales bacterium]|nr:BON domain-containing protein [Chitinivibrionales bacterium]
MAVSAEEIRKSVVEHLLWDGRLEGAEIDVNVDASNKVTLTGTAPSYLIKQAAGEDALSVSRVSEVYNQIKVKANDKSGPWRSGEALRKTIEDILSMYPNFAADSLEVWVTDGKVGLSGSVDMYWKKLRAEEIAFDVKGVQEVANEITVVPTRQPLDEEIANSIKDALRRTGGADPSQVSIEVEGGRVTLSGTVDTWTAYTSAHSAAKYTRGVVDLVNRLMIKNPD